MKRTGFWLLFAITMTLYATILFWSLPQITSAAGGLPPFDLRPGGYSYDEAVGFLTALTLAGRAFYRGTQHLLDAVYPPLMSLTLFFALAALAKPIGGWRWALASLALPIAVFDLCENIAVDRLLDAGTAITADLVATASLWTVLKSGLTTAVMSLLLGVLIVRGIGATYRRMVSPGAPGRWSNS